MDLKEARQKYRELDRQIQELKQERSKYENIIHECYKKEMTEQRSKDVEPKFFKQKDGVNYCKSYPEVKYFSVVDDSYLDIGYVRALCLIDDGLKQTYGFCFKNLWLWNADESNMLDRGERSMAKFEPCSEEEFNKVKQTWSNNLVW